MNNFLLPALTLVTGGAASGKSRIAEKLITDSELPRIYIATAQAWDDEMRQKISQHRDRRNGWRDVEAPLDVAGALADVQHGEAVLLDCLTMWLTNHLLADTDLDRETRLLCDALSDCAGRVVAVTNEVGQGIVPDNALSRRFREAQGRLNQQVAQQAQAVTAVISGLPLVLKAPS